MDNASDSYISFNDAGICNYCQDALAKVNTTMYFPGEEGARRLNCMLDTVKSDNSSKKYDCVMGISGGLDSSYLAYLGFTWGLRVLAVHIDDGYDTEISKRNIARLVDAAHMELRTIRPDSEQFNDLTLAYMKAGVPNLAIPQDNILFAFLYDTVKQEHLKYFLTGGNFALECILQQGNSFNAMDTRNLKNIHANFGTKPVDRLKFISSYTKYIRDKRGVVKTLRPLNLIDYRRNRAFAELKDFRGFEYYGSKHLENKLTAFIQLYWLPRKFGVDKRTSHLSSMIVSGQITRSEALDELAKPLYNEETMESYIVDICSKLGISRNQLEEYVNAPPHAHEEYGTDMFGSWIRKALFS